MKNILGTENKLGLFNENGIKVYKYFKNSFGYSEECTYDSNGNVLTFKNSNRYSYEYTRDSNGNVLTFKNSDGFSCEATYDSNGKVLTYKDSSGHSSEYTRDSIGYSYEYTRDSNGNELTFKDSNGVRRGFDKTYTPEEIEFIKRAVEYYWQDWNKEHPDNEKDWNLTQQILSK